MIKKPITSKKPAAKTPPAKPVSKLKKNRPAPEPEDEDEDANDEDAEEDEPEDETPKQRRLRLKAEAEAAEAEEEDSETETEEEDAEEEEAPRRKGSAKKNLKKSKKEKRSLADVFDSTKPASGAFPEGEYEAIVTLELVGEIAEDIEDQEELKVVASFVGDGNGDEEIDEKKIGRQQYILWTDDGEPGTGIEWLKKDLDILGYEDVVLADLEDIIADIEAEGTRVVIKNKEKSGYVNSYIQGLADGE